MVQGQWGGDLDISEYLAKLPDQGRCLVSPVSVMYVSDGQTEYKYADINDPRLVGLGPPECSTCTDVVLTPEIIWDVNFYYRELGFSFPYKGITKKDLRLSFLEVGGPNSERLMYVFKQLIDSEIRSKYDRASLGEMFMDFYVQDALYKRALREAMKRNAPRTEDGTIVDGEVEKILQEWGLDVKPKTGQDGTSTEDGDAPDGDDEKPAAVSDPSAKVAPWRWSYYSWRSIEWDTTKLARWQQMLVSQFSLRKINRTFAVGYLGKQPHRYIRSVVDGRTVFFLNEDTEPTDELAFLAVMQEITDEK